MNIAELVVLLGVKPDKSWNSIPGFIKGVQRSVAKVAAAFALDKIVNLAEYAGETAVHLKSLSEQTGLSAESLQEWQYVAEQAGSNANELSIGLVRLSKNMKAYLEGRNTEGTRSLTEAGLTREEIRAAMTSSEGFEHVLSRISDRFHDMGNNANRAALSNRLFGRQAKSMVSDMARGSKEIEHLKQQIRRRGAIISNQDVENLAKLGNRFNNVKQELRAFAMQAMVRVGPQVIEMLDKLTEWLSAHRDMIYKFLGTAAKATMFIFRNLGKTLEVVLKVVNKLVDVAATIWDFFTSGSDEGNAALALLGTIIVGMIIPAVVALLAWMKLMILYGITMAAINLAAFWPWLLAAVAIAALVYITLKLIRHWDKVKALARAIGQAFIDSGKMIARGFWTVIDAIRDGLKAAFDVLVQAPGIKQLIWLVKKIDDLFSVTGATMSPDEVRARLQKRQTDMQSVGRDRIPASDSNSGAKTSNNVFNVNMEVTNNGVKDAETAGGKMGNAVQDGLNRALRHAAGTFGS